MSILSNFPIQKSDQIEVIELFEKLMGIGNILRPPTQAIDCVVESPVVDPSELGSERPPFSDFC
jgi:hypothetical protein